MEYNLNINQRAIVENFPLLDIKDAAIIDFLGRFAHSKSIQKKVEGETIYYWFSYAHIANENPLLRLNVEAIRKRMRVFCELQILVGHEKNQGGKSFFAFGEKYEKTHREENPEVPKLPQNIGKKIPKGREENPEVAPKHREENPDNHNNHLIIVTNNQREEEKEKTSPPPAENFSLEAEKETPPHIAPVPSADPTRLTIHDPETPGAAILDIVSTEPQTQPPANRINLGDRATAETPMQLQQQMLAFYNDPNWQREWLDGVWRINGVWIPDNSEKQRRLESILLDFCCHTVKKNGGRDTYRELNAGFQQWVRNEKNAFWKQKPASTTNTPATDSNFYRRNQQTK